MYFKEYFGLYDDSTAYFYGTNFVFAGLRPVLIRESRSIDDVFLYSVIGVSESRPNTLTGRAPNFGRLDSIHLYSPIK